MVKKKTSFKKEFISKHLGNQTNWPREMKILNTLSSKYSDEGFWLGLEIKFKIFSLAWLLTQSGEKFLKEEWAKFKFQPQVVKKFEIEENLDIEEKPNKIIKNTSSKKIKSLNDFLKIWKQ